MKIILIMIKKASAERSTLKGKNQMKRTMNTTLQDSLVTENTPAEEIW